MLVEEEEKKPYIFFFFVNSGSLVLGDSNRK